MPKTIRVAAAGDIHAGSTDGDRVRDAFRRVEEQADLVLLAGDLTRHGQVDEIQVVADACRDLQIPVVAVLGNHDWQSDRAHDLARCLSEAGVVVLERTHTVLRVCGVTVGIAGVKGFAGGYGRATLGSWGERSIKTFVNEAIQEALKLESALAKLRTAERLAVLHYSPIEATVQGEPIEIFPFLGTSRLEEPLIRYPVSTVLHGHAHRGSPEGRTVNGTPVYNVALPLLKRTYPDRPAFRLIELPRAAAAA